jgi:hypothetical protein
MTLTKAVVCQVDVNNANIRVYTRFPGMYPTIAGLLVKVS